MYLKHGTIIRVENLRLNRSSAFGRTQCYHTAKWTLITLNNSPSNLQIRASLSPHQRSPHLKQIVINTESHNWFRQKEQQAVECSILMVHLDTVLNPQGPLQQRYRKDCSCQRQWVTGRKHIFWQYTVAPYMTL